jgi:hypothetical protein
MARLRVHLRRSGIAALVGVALGWGGCTGDGAPPADDAGEEAPRCLELGDLEAPPQATTEPTCGPAQSPENPAHLATLDLTGVLAEHAFADGAEIDLDLDCEVAVIDQAGPGEAVEVTLRCAPADPEQGQGQGQERGDDAALEIPLRLGAAAVRAPLCEGERLDLWVLAFDALHCGRSHAYGLTREDGALLVAGAKGAYNLLQDRAAPVDVTLVAAGCEVSAYECVETERAAIAVALGDGPPGLIYEGTRRRLDGAPGFMIQADHAEERRVAQPCHDCSSIDVVLVGGEAVGG